MVYLLHFNYMQSNRHADIPDVFDSYMEFVGKYKTLRLFQLFKNKSKSYLNL